jgi:hypothetical protein
MKIKTKIPENHILYRGLAKKLQGLQMIYYRAEQSKNNMDRMIYYIIKN